MIRMHRIRLEVSVFLLREDERLFRDWEGWLGRRAGGVRLGTTLDVVRILVCLGFGGRLVWIELWERGTTRVGLDGR